MINTGKIYRMLIAGAVMLLAAGCSYVEDPGVPCPKPDTESDGNVHLNFLMTSDAKLTGGTRSDDLNHPEIGSDLALEETINTNDFAFYIFVGKEGESGIDWNNAPLLYANYRDINGFKNPYTMITGADGNYNVTVTLKSDLLESILGRTLDPASDAAVNFRMVLMANSTGGFGYGFPNYEKIPHEPLTTTYSQVISAAGNIYVESANMHEDSRDNYGDTSDGVFKGYIPMYGNIFTPVTERDLCASRPYERLFLGNVWMLRSFAKVRIHDNIQDKNNEFPRLHSAVMTYTVPNAYLLPDNAASYVNGTQVHQMRECKENGRDVNYGDDTSLLLPFISTRRRVLTGYLPEQSIQGAVPVLTITVQTSPFASAATATDGRLTYKPQSTVDFEEHTRTFVVPLSGYKGTQFTWGDKILRNHVYDLNVDFKDGTELTLTANVRDWEQSRLELDYLQNPVVSQTVRWTDDTYSTVDYTDGQIYLKPWDSESNRVAAVCGFTIDAPRGARWTAYLIPAGGASGAFMFKVGSDAQGDLLEETVSGTTGTPARLEIVSVDPNPSQNNAAILQVVVAMDGGTRFMEARVAGGSIKNWTVNQARQ